MRLKVLSGVLLLTAAIVAAGCGYGFRGTVSYLPPELKTVAIPYLNNDTSEAGLETVITDALIREFNRSKLLRLEDEAHADLILRGQIVFVGSGAVAYQNTQTALQRRVEVAVNMDLVRTDNRKIIWRQRGMREGEEYDVDADTTTTEENRETALKETATNLARKIHDSIFENF